ncbi:unnamed protein product [Prunus armeniaca]
MLTNQYDAKVKIFQTNGGGEFTSTLFTAFLDSKGFIHHLSCPHTAQQNGLAKRKNRHVIDTAITLLFAASLPTKFWVHSIAHAVYLINRMPNEVLNHQSPFLKLFGHTTTKKAKDDGNSPSCIRFSNRREIDQHLFGCQTTTAFHRRCLSVISGGGRILSMEGPKFQNHLY